MRLATALFFAAAIIASFAVVSVPFVLLGKVEVWVPKAGIPLSMCFVVASFIAVMFASDEDFSRPRSRPGPTNKIHRRPVRREYPRLATRDGKPVALPRSAWVCVVLAGATGALCLDSLPFWVLGSIPIEIPRFSMLACATLFAVSVGISAFSLKSTLYILR